MTDKAEIYDDPELWKDIIDYEGVYQISNHGRIKSLERTFIKNKKGGKEKMGVFMKETIRAISLSDRYPKISLWDNGSVKWFLIHRLVGIYFVANLENYPKVLHKDDNTHNPHHSNLMWGTQSQNIKDCSNKDRGFRGKLNNNAKLMDADIPKIRKLISEGMPSRKIGKIFGVTKTPILWIANNKSWTHIK